MSLKWDSGICVVIPTPGVILSSPPHSSSRVRIGKGQPCSREFDLGVKTQRQGGLQADCSWPCAGQGHCAPWGLFRLHKRICDVARPATSGWMLFKLRGTTGLSPASPRLTVFPPPCCLLLTCRPRQLPELLIRLLCLLISRLATMYTTWSVSDLRSKNSDY